MTQKQTKSVMNKYFSLLFKVAAAMLMSIFVFFGIGVVIWVTFSLWRIGKEEVGLSGWGATGMIFLSVVIEASLGMFSRSLSMTM